MVVVDPGKEETFWRNDNVAHISRSIVYLAAIAVPSHAGQLEFAFTKDEYIMIEPVGGKIIIELDAEVSLATATLN